MRAKHRVSMVERLQAKFRGDRAREIHVARANTGAAFVCPFVSSSPEVVRSMVDAAELTERDIVVDLGCGDGSILLDASRRGLTGLSLTGIDIDPVLVATARRRLSEACCHVEIFEQDIIDYDLSRATVVFTFLVPNCMEALSTRLKTQLTTGSRIIAYKFGLPSQDGWLIEKTWDVEDVIKSGGRASVYLYLVH